jgi:hypothetical protein
MRFWKKRRLQQLRNELFCATVVDHVVPQPSGPSKKADGIELA